MLNVLMSFAQFEREIGSERTREKIHAARKKGRYTGGHPPLGYDLDKVNHRLFVNPEEAVKIHRDLGAVHSIGMHWGTFLLTDEPVDEPPRRLATALRAAEIPPERFWLMKHGETRRLE